MFVSDFYDSLNGTSEGLCYQEFGAPDIEDIRKLRGIIGRHVYAKPYEKDSKEYYKLIIE